MTRTSREITKGAISGAGILIAMIALNMPIGLAVLIGAAMYAGLALFLPQQAVDAEISAAPGLSDAERNQFLQACRQSATDLAQLSGQIADRGFRDNVQKLARVAAGLTDYFEKKPESILLAGAVPQNLARIGGMLRQYIAIRKYEAAGHTAEEAIRRVEEIVTRAQGSFEGMFQQLVENDVAALEASARTLAILMDVDTSPTAGPRAFPESPVNPGRPAGIARQPQKEKPT